MIAGGGMETRGGVADELRDICFKCVAVSETNKKKRNDEHVLFLHMGPMQDKIPCVPLGFTDRKCFSGIDLACNLMVYMNALFGGGEAMHLLEPIRFGIRREI